MNKFVVTSKIFWSILFLALTFLVLVIIFFELSSNINFQSTSQENPLTLISRKPKDLENQLPTSQILNSRYHIYQTFNNCAPAALSMALSYFEININHDELAKMTTSLLPQTN